MRAPTFSPQGFLARALLATLFFAALHLVGLREHAAILSGTMPASVLETGAGVLYVSAYFGAVIGAPILVLGGLIFAGLGLVIRRRRSAPASPEM